MYSAMKDACNGLLDSALEVDKFEAKSQRRRLAVSDDGRVDVAVAVTPKENADGGDALNELTGEINGASSEQNNWKETVAAAAESALAAAYGVNATVTGEGVGAVVDNIFFYCVLEEPFENKECGGALNTALRQSQEVADAIRQVCARRCALLMSVAATAGRVRTTCAHQPPRARLCVAPSTVLRGLLLPSGLLPHRIQWGACSGLRIDVIIVMMMLTHLLAWMDGRCSTHTLPPPAPHRLLRTACNRDPSSHACPRMPLCPSLSRGPHATVRSAWTRSSSVRRVMPKWANMTSCVGLRTRWTRRSAGFEALPSSTGSTTAQQVARSRAGLTRSSPRQAAQAVARRATTFSIGAGRAAPRRSAVMTRLCAGPGRLAWRRLTSARGRRATPALVVRIQPLRFTSSTKTIHLQAVCLVTSSRRRTMPMRLAWRWLRPAALLLSSLLVSPCAEQVQKGQRAMDASTRAQILATLEQLEE